MTIRTRFAWLLLGTLAVAVASGCGNSDRDKGKNSGQDRPVPSATG